MRHLALVLPLVTMLGCSDEPSAAPPAAAPVPPADTPTLTPAVDITWGPCPEGFTSECTDVTVPLAWGDPGGRTISVLLAHRPALTEPTAQLFLVMGGPGDTADIFARAGLVDALAQLAPGVEVFVLEHRGVGQSTRLSCAAEDRAINGLIPVDAMPSCLAELRATWGDDGLAQFSTEAAARDLHAVVERVRAPGRPVVLYGVSYGTYLVQGFLHLFPEASDAAVLDSVVAPGDYRLDNYDTHWDTIARKLADRCAADDICRANAGDDPWATLGEGVAALREGRCGGVTVSAEALQGLVIPMLDDRVRREHLVPLMTRAVRCAPGDADAVAYYLAGLNALPPLGSPADSDVIRTQISLAEEWARPAPPTVDVRARCNQALFCPAVADRLAQLAEFWPLYPRLLDGPAATSRPLLVLQGTMDGKTPDEIAQALAPRMTAPGQSFVTFADMPHAVIANSPTRDGNPVPCGVRLLAQFTTDPLAPLDATCARDLTPIDFVGREDENLRFFGTSDRWR
jgi:pimeloyl-ACP methyl ester carboxylesterase